MLVAPSLALLLLAGLGAGVLLPLRRGELGREEPLGRRRTAALLAATLGYGVLVDYVLVLLVGSLSRAIGLGLALAVVGIFLAAIVVRPRRPGRFEVSWLAALPLLWLLVLVGIRIVGEPIENWDARSIWFFGAKLILHQGGLEEAAGFGALPFGHQDYPKLLATLGAQVAFAAGYWNEYLPKLALLVLLVPALLGFLSFLDRPLAWIFLVALCFLRMRHVLWNGQVDAYLALYAALAALALGRFLMDGRSHDLGLGLMSVGMLVSLKNEGLPLAACLAVAIAGVALVAWRRGSGPRPVPWGLAAWLGLAALAGLGLWELKKAAWGLQGDFDLSPATLATAWARYRDGELPFVAGFLFETRGLARALPPLGLAMVAALAFRTRPPAAFWVALFAGALYLGGVVLAYLGTPRDLNWHLRTSSHRTVLPLFTLAFVAAYWLLDAVEAGRTPAPETERPA